LFLELFSSIAVSGIMLELSCLGEDNSCGFGASKFSIFTFSSGKIIDFGFCACTTHETKNTKNVKDKNLKLFLIICDNGINR
jgi:hypothetical protein